MIPVELPEGQSGQQALAVEKLQKRAELMGATKAGTWCVNCETYQAVTTFSKYFCYLFLGVPGYINRKLILGVLKISASFKNVLI